jgi:O-antigen/teichoic acid export membrane protein
VALDSTTDAKSGDSAPTNYMWLWIPSVIASACCAYVAIGHPSEYGIYTAARITVTIAACLLAYSFYKKNQEIKFSCVGLAIVFNPVVTLHLGRGLWVVADFFAIAVLMISTLQVQKN